LRTLRALWRLIRSVLHMLHGVGIVLFGGFMRWPPPRRQARIQWWAAKMLRMLGVRLVASGTPQPGPVLLVANHVSWLDIVALHAVCPQTRFVSKSELAHWPLIGTLVAAANTLFIQRERKRDAVRVVGQMAQALREGGTVAVFPEGTTGPGEPPLPFHANLLQSAIEAQVPVQPVALRFSDDRHAVSPAAAYVGDTSLLQSLWWVVNAEGLTAHACWLPALASGEADDRRALCDRLRQSIADAIAQRA
jgi:1-acyl-sn-glycerol-3-phosphate acyltransferase